MRRVAVAGLGSIALAGCATQAQTLDLRLAQLQRIEASDRAIAADVAAGAYDPAKYDFYLMLNRSLFDQLLRNLAGTTVELPFEGRTIELTLGQVAFDFRPGNSSASIAATAIDPVRKIQVGIALDAQLLVETDPAKPGALLLRPVVTRVDPQVSIGSLDLTRAKFVRSLIALKVTQYSEKLPQIALPVERSFAMGGPGGTRPTGRIDTGNGSWIEGNLTLPGSELSGRFVIAKILFLSNGVHLFANLEAQ